MNAKALLALIDECGMIELVNRSGRDSDGWIQETILRALRLLAAAERNDGERSQLIEELRTEADLCRNETADDVADLLDDAASSLIATGALFKALKDERNGLAARVGELESERDALKQHAEEVKRDLAASVVKSAELGEENSKLRSALAIVHFKWEPWQ